MCCSLHRVTDNDWGLSQALEGDLVCFRLKVAGPSMLAIDRPDRHVLPLTTLPKRSRVNNRATGTTSEGRFPATDTRRLAPGSDRNGARADEKPDRLPCIR
jgi:hypothetical protein